ncbi:MAG TPA: flagellar biosynthetic protein FliR [Tepidisphaeraceae bacterium]|nr:flagellar biosynthetic protein FliR [Tepidisphaeraceae bacterium]
MSFDEALQLVPVFVLTLVRVAAMMLYAPVLGSGRVPRRVKGMLAAVLALGMTPGVPRPAQLPETAWGAAVGIGGEIVFGLAMGMAMSAAFVAAQWAGEMIGQQMGLTLGEVFDPQYGSHGSVVGDMYFMLALVVFLTIGGHLQMVRGLQESFRHLPILAVGMNRDLFDLIVGLVGASATLAFRLAAPVLVTMLVVDLALGLIGKAMPQFNVMAAGMTLRSIVGTIVIVVGIGLTTGVMSEALNGSLGFIRDAWRGMVPAGR